MTACPLLLLLAACAAAPDSPSVTVDDLAAAASIGPQSFTHGTISAAQPHLAYAFRGSAGEAIAADVWPTGQSPLRPWLMLFGPRGPEGHRKVLAHGQPRNGELRHLAIDNFHLPETGGYLLIAGGDGGQFTLRLWMRSSHLPRQETWQVDLTAAPSAAMVSAAHAHESGALWTDAQVESLSAGIEQEQDLRVALSDAHLLLWLLAAAQGGSADQIARARRATAQVVGTPQHFRSLERTMQAFALFTLEGLFFASAEVATPPPIEGQIARLIATWPGAREDASLRRARTRSFESALYGWQVETAAEQRDLDGRQVWLDLSTEWFDSRTAWLGESSAGAGEPDD
jgi:hypothetical protein